MRTRLLEVVQMDVITPPPSNIFPHHALNRWMEESERPRPGARRLIRYADDFVIACRTRRDRERAPDSLGKRFGRMG